MQKYQLIAGILVVSLACASAQFTDEIQVYEEECLGEDKFHCLDGECIRQEHYCNHIKDCRDGSDENFCPGRHIVTPMDCNSTHQYMCLDRGKCIPFDWLCNNNTDCDDGSDENYCSTALNPINDTRCSGFSCDGGAKCLSWLWVCDGTIDCEDQGDEYNETLCRLVKDYTQYKAYDGRNCDRLDVVGRRQYQCRDQSYCVQAMRMCDNVRDCRDGSDEGAYCANWKKMCKGVKCGGGAVCRPDPDGPSCECGPGKQYSAGNRTCVDLDECQAAQPSCSHKCINKEGRFSCECEPGYTSDRFEYLCFAPDPEPFLFFATRHEIKYYKVKSRVLVTAVTGVKQAHGVSYDGTFLYWVEKAEGHQAIVRAKLDDVDNTKQTLIALGLDDPGDISYEHSTNTIYLTDAERGHIAVCSADAAVCTRLNTSAAHPKFLTLHPQRGEMYWLDYLDRPVIMRANMDGSSSHVLTDAIVGSPTGLALDAASERLYYVDRHIMCMRLDNNGSYVFLNDALGHPYSIAVFENTVFWSDWTSNTIQVADKIHPPTQKRRVLLTLDSPVFGIHIYHPLLLRQTPSGCAQLACSDLCVLRAGAAVCACHEGRSLVNNNTCAAVSVEHLPEFLIVGGGAYFTMVRYNSLGNPEARATTLDIGRVQAMAYDNNQRTLYVYDGQRKTINYIGMSEFSRGVTRLLEHRGLDNVMDMGYDYVAKALYFVDAGRRTLEVISLVTSQRATVHRFERAVPISVCVLSEHGLLMVAVVERERNNEIHVDSMGLDGAGRSHVITTGLKGPHVRLRYSHVMDNVYISDEGNGAIYYIHPSGTGKEQYRVLSTSVTSLSVSDTTVFWADRRTPRLFWSGIHETSHRVRRMTLSMFPNGTQLHLQTTAPAPHPALPLMQHPCARRAPCSHVCVQLSHPTVHQAPLEYYMGYACLCPAGLIKKGDNCEPLASCLPDQVYCHGNNTCATGRRCDGVDDCPNAEDEYHCYLTTEPPEPHCSSEEKLCGAVCVHKTVVCNDNATVDHQSTACADTQFQCVNDSAVCIQRWQRCDGEPDCRDLSDELACDLAQCWPHEFMCASGSCILSSWRCDRDEDCADGSDEVNCENRTCAINMYQCHSGECIEMKKRCDANQDCLDLSDEEDCLDMTIPDMEPEVKCGFGEYTCASNRSICLPITARCNTRVDCPDGSDEADCEYLCSETKGLFKCEQEEYCISQRLVCDGVQHCRDGSDEARWRCFPNKPKKPSPPAPVFPASCPQFRCSSGECAAWRQVCDQAHDCGDASDEGPACLTACDNHTCEHSCQSTPTGPVCQCAAGMTAVGAACADIDECRDAVCSHLCHNVPGTFYCSCFTGYANRWDRRGCKATSSHLSILYVSGNCVRAITPDSHVTQRYNNKQLQHITGMDYDVRRDRLFVTSQSAGKLILVNSTHGDVAVTNVGTPTKVAVDWVTGNVYFVDASAPPKIRVCDVSRKRCALIIDLPAGAQVTALAVDPANAYLLYCVHHDLEYVLWLSSLSGHRTLDLATVSNCSALTADSFRHRALFADAPPRLVAVPYNSPSSQVLIESDANFQSPHSLALFEDHIYFLVANTFKLSRCLLYSTKTCEPFLYRIFDANTFVLNHESAQRGDVKNTCEGFVCDGVCVLGEEGPQCVCQNGRLSVDGTDCDVVEKELLPLFNGWSSADAAAAGGAWLPLLVGAPLLMLLCVAVALLRRCRGRGANAMPVRFRNASPLNEGEGQSHDATIEFPIDANTHEFVNPLEFVRHVWERSFSRRRRRPVGTAGLTIEVPPTGDNSDTESDLDNKDTQLFFRK